MANILDLLAGLFGQRQAAAALPQTGGGPDLQITPAYGDLSSLRLPGMGGAAPTPAQQVAAPPAALPQLPTSAPAQGSPMPTPPIKPVHSWLVNALDQGLLGGAIATHDAQALGQQQAVYQYGQMKRYAETLPAELQQAFWADPQGVMTAWEKNKLERATLKGGETDFNPLQSPDANYTAPQLDEKSGTYGRPVNGGAGVVQSPSLGGDFSAKDGVVVSGRTGAVPGGYAQSVKLAPGEHIGSFVPGVVGVQSPAGALPQLPSAGGDVSPPPATTAGMPSLAQLPQVLPGARVTSGLRSPQHNAEVDGVANSWHLMGTPDAPGALDLQPPPGVPMGAFAGQVAQRLPQARVLNEGNHIHVQPNARNTGAALPVKTGPQTDATGSLIDNGPPTGPMWSAPKYNPQTNRLEQTNTATGEVRDAGQGAFNPETLRKSVLDHEDFKQATSAMAAYKAMIGNADKMTGPSAYSMLDTFARAINPGAVARPQVIQTIESNLGLPAQMIGSLDSKFGKGNLPPDTRQQILDAVVKFAQAHWDAADALNQSNKSVAGRTGLDPANVVAPLGTRPVQMHLKPVSKDQLKSGDIYQTARGAAVWNGQAFTPFR